MTITKRILIDVDTQHDFMDPSGSLFVEADPSVRENIKNILMSASIDGIGETYDAILGSVDSHAYDAWEFSDNGGPFPAHCVKGQPGWLRTNPDFPAKQRFLPMTHVKRDHHDQVMYDPFVYVGENEQGQGARKLNIDALAHEAVEGKVGLYFEKEVYSLFDNPLAMLVLNRVGNLLGGNWNNIQIDVIGYCTGGYCVDAAVKGLCNAIGINRAKIRVLSYATAAIGGAEGMAKSKAELVEYGAEWVEEA